MRAAVAVLAATASAISFGFIAATAASATLATGAPVSGSVIVADESGLNSQGVAIGVVDEVAPNGSELSAGTSVDDPASVAVDATGNVYIANSASSYIEEYSFTGIDSQVGSEPEQQNNFSPLSEPTGVAVDSQGNVYVADYGNDRVVEFAAVTGVETVLATGLTPWGIAVDPSGDVFVADQTNDTIAEIPAGESGLAGPGDGTADGSGWIVAANLDPNDPSGANLDLNAPYGIGLDASGDLYVALEDASAVVEVPAGQSTASPFLSNVNATDVSVGANGDVYVSAYDDTGTDGTVTSYTATGALIATVASGFSFPDGVAAYPPVDVSDPLVATVSATAVYGGAYHYSVTYSGFTGGDTSSVVTGTLSCETLYDQQGAATPVGSTPFLECSGLSVPSKYQLNYVLGDVTVTPSALTIEPATTQTIYGSKPAIAPEYIGLVAGDQSVFSNGATTPATCTTTALATSPAGSTFPTSCSGAVDPNYTITYVPGTVTVEPAPLTVDAPSPVMTYGGTVPSLTPTYTGFVNTDSASSLSTKPTCVTTATAKSSVGSYPVTCSGAVDSNYTISYQAGSLTIGPAPLSIAASSPTITLGASIPAITPTYTGFVNGDTAASLATAPSCSTTATSSQTVGSFPTSCSGAIDPNYTISYTAGILAIGLPTLTIDASSASMTYGGTVPSITASYSGFVNGQGPSELTTLPTCVTTATSTAKVGTYTTSCSGAVAPGYLIVYGTGTVTVDPAPLSITASSATVAYGQAPPTVTPTYSGLVAGDTAASLTTAPVCTTTEKATSALGTYPSTCSGAVDANYTITYVAGTITVAAATITVTASSATEVYGQTPAAVTPSYTGFVDGNTVSSLATAATCSTTATAKSPVGTYATTCSGAKATDYVFSYVPGIITVTPAPLTVTASSATIAAGAAAPAITPSYSGFVNGDTAASLTTAPTCTTTAGPTSTAGTYPSTCSGAVDANYTITYVAGTVRVGSVTVTVSATSTTKLFGAALPPLTATLTGLPTGTTATSLGITGQPACTTTALASSTAGTYPITCTKGTLTGANVTFSFVPGVLTVRFSANCISGWYWGNVLVGPGQADCTSPGTVVFGSTDVLAGGSLDVEGTIVTGDVLATNANQLRVCSSLVLGRVAATGSRNLVTIGDAHENCGGNLIYNGVSAVGNSGGVELSGNDVWGSVVLASNTGTLPAPESGSLYDSGNALYW